MKKQIKEFGIIFIDLVLITVYLQIGFIIGERLSLEGFMCGVVATVFSFTAFIGTRLAAKCLYDSWCILADKRSDDRSLDEELAKEERELDMTDRYCCCCCLYYDVSFDTRCPHCRSKAIVRVNSYGYYYHTQSKIYKRELTWTASKYNQTAIGLRARQEQGIKVKEDE